VPEIADEEIQPAAGTEQTEKQHLE
jgi:hypothetical protein